MLLIKAIIRPEKSADTIKTLFDNGFPAMTKMDVSGRGAQMGLKGDSYFDELPKDMIYIACEDSDKDAIVDIITKTAATGEHGDGRIYISKLEEAYTISTGEKGL